jgi:hypothetical protein
LHAGVFLDQIADFEDGAHAFRAVGTGRPRSAGLACRGRRDYYRTEDDRWQSLA